MDYMEIYKKRLNRYGENYNARVQNQREAEFDHYLLKSTSRVDIEYNNETIPASFERYKQDETETLAYLLTRRKDIIPSGTILLIEGKNWMVYWLEEIQASGYNKYTMLKMTHCIEWKDRNGNKQSACAYMYGQQDNMLKDELRSRSRSDVLYTEALKMSFFVTPTNKNINKDDYFTISIKVGDDEIKEGYRVTGYDIQSTPGVEYVTVDPVYLRDETPQPVFDENTDEENDFFWFNGGV